MPTATPQHGDGLETPPPGDDAADEPLVTQTPVGPAGRAEGQPDAASASVTAGDSAGAAPSPAPAIDETGGNEGAANSRAEEGAVPPVAIASEEVTPPATAQDTVGPPVSTATVDIATAPGLGATPAVALAQPTPTPALPASVTTPLPTRLATTPSAARQTPTLDPSASPTPAPSPRAAVAAATPPPTTTPRPVPSPTPTTTSAATTTAAPTPTAIPAPTAPHLREVPLDPGTRAVVHAQGECLRVRDSGSLSATTIACIASGVSVSVLDGAIERDGYRWQKISVGRAEGWAADVYLEPAGAAAPPPSTPAVPAESRILSPSELRAALELSAWPGDLWLTVERIIRCESGGNLDAVGPLGHRGLMQVAPWFHGPVPTDAVGQLNQGHQVYLKQGWQAWECY
ncbi:MAG: hypothetical protein AB7I38_00345 [Dehalococcoidia bacterium]